MGGDAAIIPSYDEITLCNPAFKTLRSMVNAWLLEVSIYKNVFADYQLIHFYRYVITVRYCHQLYYLITYYSIIQMCMYIFI